MNYSSGENPEVGDVVRDGQGKVGFVAYIVHFNNNRQELVIDWDDGTVGIRYSTLDDLSLLRRRRDVQEMQHEGA